MNLIIKFTILSNFEVYIYVMILTHKSDVSLLQKKKSQMYQRIWRIS